MTLPTSYGWARASILSIRCTFGMIRGGWIPVTSFSRIHLLDPPSELSTNSNKSWIFRADELGHVHVVAVDPDRNIPRKNG